MITLALLNVFLVTAALAVVKLTPDRSLAVRPPTVAARSIVVAGPPALTAAPASAPLPVAGSLAARLDTLMRAAGLGANLSGTVIDAATGRPLFSSRADVPAVPASTTKLTTAVAVLASAGPDRRLTTSAVRGGGGVILVGGGDLTLTTVSPKNGYPRPASLTDLAKQTARALKAAGTTQVSVDYDASAYQGKRTGPGWKPNYVSDGDVGPVAALELDEGRVAPGAPQRVLDPPRIAAAAFARLLTRQGVTARVGAQTTAPQGARRLGAVQSPPISALVEQLLTNSDNDIAEAMIRQVAIKLHRPPTFEGAASAVHDVLTGLGVAAGVDTVDGSGLSPRNQITPAALARLLAMAASDRHPELRTVMSGMPIAGFSGTLASRYGAGRAATGRGLVRAKTGTLNGVNTLAGVVDDADGRLLAFAFMANNVRSPAAALAALDTLAGALAGCGCR
jgi:D-alanyl-D-alanine carboxypeptidase/D-alanyl-D-alanine-endopeptidase (penicillin-binding protein 4)